MSAENMKARRDALNLLAVAAEERRLGARDERQRIVEALRQEALDCDITADTDAVARQNERDLRLMLKAQASTLRAFADRLEKEALTTPTT